MNNEYLKYENEYLSTATKSLFEMKQYFPDNTTHLKRTGKSILCVENVAGGINSPIQKCFLHF
jgi:hypothetical protein